MKHSGRLLLLLLLSLVVTVHVTVSAQTPAAYDSTLAKRLGADDHGMRRYTFVLLKPGPRTDLPKAERDSLFSGHMDNINRMAEAGQLVLAGPFMKNPDFSGIYIFTTPTAAEVEPLLQSDPAIKGGALAYQIYGWYGSAAVMEIPQLHERIERKKH